MDRPLDESRDYGPWPDRPREAPARARDTHGHRRPSARLVATWLRAGPGDGRPDGEGREGPGGPESGSVGAPRSS
ncbi:MAG: hypothetical protein L0216_04565 [Planctomycetales bacterium]|nr:hypothetical protein [Planctomycetales bacterium]